MPGFQQPSWDRGWLVQLADDAEGTRTAEAGGSSFEATQTEAANFPATEVAETESGTQDERGARSLEALLRPRVFQGV